MPFIIELLDRQDNGVSNVEVTVRMAGGIEAQAYCLVGQRTEHAAAVFSGNDGLSAAADGVAFDGAEEGVRHGLLDGDPHLPGLPVVFFQNAVQLLTRMVPLPEIGGGSIGQILLAQAHVPAAALHQAPLGAHRRGR